MKQIQLILILFLTAIIFTSCEKDGFKDGKKDYDKEECFELIFPLTYDMPDGSKVSLEDEKDSGLKDWYDENPSIEEKPVILYPVDIKIKSEIFPVQSDEEFAKIKESCDKYKDDKKDCFEWVYPIGFNMPDGSELILENDEDSGLKDWYETNISEKEKPEFVYPISIVNSDGSISSLENFEALVNALKGC